MGVTFGVAGRYLARVRSIPGGADLRRRVRHLERRGALVRDLTTRGAAEGHEVKAMQARTWSL